MDAYKERIAAALERIAAALEAQQRPKRRSIQAKPGHANIQELVKKYMPLHAGKTMTMDEILEACCITDATPGMRKAIGHALGDYGAVQRRTKSQRLYMVPMTNFQPGRR